jgi:hypothetical protein
MRNLVSVAAAMSVALLPAAPAMSQAAKAKAKAPAKIEQKINPPKARYWLGATTGGGVMAMSAMGQGGGRLGMGDAMRMATQGIPTEARTVELRLGSSLSPSSAEADAQHTMPKDAQVNKSIHLITPTPTSGGVAEPPGPYKQPKGQITFYWGCHEKAPKGQPVVLTYDKLLRGESDSELRSLDASVSAREVSKPALASSKTYGEYPQADPKDRNKGLRATFPAGATLAGQHVIEGNYSPRIEFVLPSDKTFLDGVKYTSTAVDASGAIKLAWSPIVRATGYSIGVMAPEKVNDDSASLVMWSSAERPATFIQNSDLSPAEVQRLISLKAVLAPETTTCAIPAEVIKATKDGSILMFTAFGDQATFVFPPRPEDPKVTWDQEWFARISFKSARMDMISKDGVQDLGAQMAAAGGGSPAAMSDADYCAMIAANKQNTPSTAEIIGSATGIPGAALLGRALGGKKKKEEPADPRCVKK